MYYPYLYGRRSEMLALRAIAQKIATKNKVIPIIEPVKKDIASLGKSVEVLVDAGANAIIITNPHQGDFKTLSPTEKNKWVHGLIQRFPKVINCTPAFKITSKTTLTDLQTFLNTNGGNVALVHAAELTGAVSLTNPINTRILHIFAESNTTTTYQNSITGIHKVLVRDSFNTAARNADYPPIEAYSDLNLTYAIIFGMSGFSDYTITGRTFSESGGPAHAVAIHFTHERTTKDIGIRHFVSDDTTIPPNDPALKIGQSLAKLGSFITSTTGGFGYSLAASKFLGLLAGGGTNLSTLKQYSIEHHIELMHELL